jgi:hypothetical protein
MNPPSNIYEITRLIMVTPFDSSLARLDEDEQLILLKGCALCTITRDLEHDSLRNKPEWQECKAALGVPISVVTIDVIDKRLRDLIQNEPPAVCAEDVSGQIWLVLDAQALKRCKGSVADFRGRLLYRASMLGLSLPRDGIGAS